MNFHFPIYVIGQPDSLLTVDDALPIWTTQERAESFLDNSPDLGELSTRLGKVKIAQVLCRAGLQLSSATVGRILKEQPAPKPAEVIEVEGNTVRAQRPNHVWHVDLTVVPTGSGLWTAWMPFALPQCWPFCWWVAVTMDHYSRRVVGYALFMGSPQSRDINAFLGRAIAGAGATPKYLICDKGNQFWCAGFMAWCHWKKIKPRFGAVGKQGSIAVLERFILTLKNECTRVILVPMRRETFRRDLSHFLVWYNEHRPHMALEGRTPEDVYRDVPSDRQEPPLDLKSKEKVTLRVDFHAGQRHLPVVTLKRAA